MARRDFFECIDLLIGVLERVAIALIEQPFLVLREGRQRLLRLNAVPESIDEGPPFFDAQLLNFVQDGRVHDHNVAPMRHVARPAPTPTVVRETRTRNAACKEWRQFTPDGEGVYVRR